MSAQRLTVTVLYSDGTEERIVVRPVGLVAAERALGGTPAVQGTLYAAWYCSSKRTAQTFDEWVESLDAVDETQDTIPPTVATPPSEPGQPSESVPA